MKHGLMLLLVVLGLWTATPPVQAQGLQYGAPAAEEVAPPVLQPGAAPRILALLAPVVIDTPLPGDLIVDTVRIDRDRIALAVHTASAPKAPAVLELELLPKQEATPGEPVSASFAIHTTHAATSPEAIALASHLTANIIAHDHGDLYVVQPVRPRQEVEMPSRAGDRLQFAVAAAALATLLLASVLWQRRRTGQWPAREKRVQITHFLPASLQLVIFAYWSLYWREMAEIAPMIALEVLAALLLDALLHLWREKKLVLTGGALPITLSTNLFVIFAPGGGWLSLAAVSLALLTKHFVRSSRGHVFNPSAIGLLVVGIVTLLQPQLGYGDTAYEFALAPNTTELILILALVVQLRLPVVLVSIGAFLGLHLAGQLYGRLSFDPVWPPIALVITLLVTDPATQPKTPVGRLLFGLLAGVLMRVCGDLLQTYLNQDFWGKVGGVALANLCVPWIDAAVAKLPQRGSDLYGVLAPKLNPLHIALWWFLMVSNLLQTDGKTELLHYSRGVQEAHVRNGTPFVQPTADGKAVRCKENPLLCDGFTFQTELACWLGDDKSPACGTGRAGWLGPGRAQRTRDVATH